MATSDSNETSGAPEPSTSTGALIAGGQRIVSQNLAVAWALAAAVGAVAISFSRGAPATRLIFPPLTMVCYLAYALSQRVRNTARVADSVYFLGFLWTLWALIDALIREGGRIGADKLFLLFGYALTTTALGMFLRLLLLQSQRTVADQVVEARAELDERLQAFSNAMKLAEQAVSAFRLEASRALTEWPEELRRSTATFQEAAMESHKAFGEQLASELQAAANGVVTSMRASAQSTATLKEELARTSTLAANASKRVGTGLEKLERTIEERTAALEQALTGLVNQIHGVEISPDGFSRSVDKFTVALDGAGDRVTTVADTLRRLPEELNALEQQVRGLSTEVVAHSAERIAEAERAIRDARDLGEKLQQTIRDVLEFLRGHLTGNG